MDSYYNYLSQSDKSTVSSLMKLREVDLRNKRKEYNEQLKNLYMLRYNTTNGKKINYIGNRISLIDYVINKKFRGKK